VRVALKIKLRESKLTEPGNILHFL